MNQRDLDDILAAVREGKIRSDFMTVAIHAHHFRDAKGGERGVNVPDDLPWREILDVAKRWLGTFHSDAVSWDPLSSRVDLYEGYNSRVVDRDDPWQFTNFLI